MDSLEEEEEVVQVQVVKISDLMDIQVVNLEAGQVVKTLAQMDTQVAVLMEVGMMEGEEMDAEEVLVKIIRTAQVIHLEGLKMEAVAMEAVITVAVSEEVLVLGEEAPMDKTTEVVINTNFISFHNILNISFIIYS